MITWLAYVWNVAFLKAHFIKTFNYYDTREKENVYERVKVKENGISDMSDLCWADKFIVTGKKLMPWTLKS